MDMNRAIDVVLVDVGGVIVPNAGRDDMESVANTLGITPAELGPLLYEWEAWYALSTGRIAEEAYWTMIGERVGWEPAAVQGLIHPIWEPAAVDTGVVALLRRISPPVRLAILSNATLRLEDHLQRLGVIGLFAPIVNSARVGLRKPDPAVFQHTLELLGVPAGAVLFVDDKRRNTDVAESLGIPSILFEGAGGLAAALARHGVLSPDAAQ